MAEWVRPLMVDLCTIVMLYTQLLGLSRSRKAATN